MQKRVNQKKVYARLKNLPITPRKVRLVVGSLSKKTISEAISVLINTPKRAALPVLKLMNSAVANATNNFKINFNDLGIFSITVNEGRKLKRFRPRARGRTYPVIKRSSHVEIVLISNKIEESDNKLLNKSVKLGDTK